MKSKWLKIVNPFLGVLFFFQITIGFLNDLFTVETFTLIHTTAAIVLLGCVMVHLYLNWGWIKTTYRSKQSG